MDARPEKAGERRSHLRLVTAALDPSAGDASGRSRLGAAARRAAEIRREREAFGAVRAATPTAGGSALPVRPAAGRGPSAPAGRAAATAAALGPRYEALAAPAPAADTVGEIDQRFERAFESLRPETEARGGELRPSAHLAVLEDAYPDAAGRWLIASLPLLHLAAPMAVLEVRLDRRTTLRAAALGVETRIDLDADRNRRLARVCGSPRRIAADSLSSSRVPRSRREGTELMRRLARFPFSIGDLAATGASAIDPISFWRLIEVAVATVPDGVGGVLCHRDPGRSGFDVAVDLQPGRPIRLLDPAAAVADAEIKCTGSATLVWACGGAGTAGRSGWLAAGDADVESLALRTVATGAAGRISHIRSRS